MVGGISCVSVGDVAGGWYCGDVVLALGFTIALGGFVSTPDRDGASTDSELSLALESGWMSWVVGVLASDVDTHDCTTGCLAVETVVSA